MDIWSVVAAWGLLSVVAVLVLARVLRRISDPNESTSEAVGAAPDRRAA